MSQLKLSKLKEEGKLQKGDQVHLSGYGSCTVSWVQSPSSITVKVNKTGQYTKITGLVLDQPVAMEEA